MDASLLIERFLTGSYTVTRRAAATITSGRAVAGAVTTLTIRASVQPASGRDLMRLEEGRRSNETRVVFTTTKLLVGEQGGANEADLVSIDGASWEVQHVETWPSTIPNFYRVVLQAAA